MTAPNVQSSRHPLLDPLRGLLALWVVLHHATQAGLGIRYGRVILFFVISGYGIFAAAESLLRARQGDTGAASSASVVRTFVTRRVRRIWPPYALSLAYFVAVAWFLRRPVTDEITIGSWVRNLTLTAWTSMIERPRLMAWQNTDLIVPAQWTLGYEMQFYVVMALGLGAAAGGLIRLRHIAIALGVLGIANLVWSLAASARSHGLIGDYSWCFALGALAYYRVTVNTRRPASAIIDASLFIAILLSAAVLALSTWGVRGGLMGAWSPSAVSRRLFAEHFISLTFTGLIILSFPISSRLAPSIPRLLSAPFRFLSAFSYSLFLVHTINLPIAAELTARTLPADPPRWVGVITQLGWHVLLATPFWWLCERPFTRRNSTARRVHRGLPANP